MLQAEGDAGAGQGGGLQEGADRAQLALVAFHEFAADREIGEQPLHGDGAAAAAGGLRFLQQGAVAEKAPPAAAVLVVRRLQVDVGHLQDRGQGLAAKAQGEQAVQVLQLHQLGGAVALERDLDVVGAEAAAVVLDAHQLLAPGAQRHGDLAGAGVDGVLHELLDHGKGALDHLAGRDLAEHVLG